MINLVLQLHTHYLLFRWGSRYRQPKCGVFLIRKYPWWKAQYGGLVYELVISLVSRDLESIAIFPASPPVTVLG